MEMKMTPKESHTASRDAFRVDTGSL